MECLFLFLFLVPLLLNWQGKPEKTKSKYQICDEQIKALERERWAYKSGEVEAKMRADEYQLIGKAILSGRDGDLNLAIAVKKSNDRARAYIPTRMQEIENRIKALKNLEG